MTADGPKKDHIADDDLLDEELPRYDAVDAILEFESGDRVDLHSLRHPFTGDEGAPGWLTGLSAQDEEGDRELERHAIGRRLRALREDLDLTQQEVAARAHVSSARIAAIESGRVALGLSDISGFIRAMGASFSDIAAPDTPEISMKRISRTARTAGAPAEIVDRLADVVPRPIFPDALTRAFEWRREELLAGAPRSTPREYAMAFKSATERPDPDSPLLAFARRASVLSAAQWTRTFAGVPESPAQLRAEVADRGGRVTLKGLLDWAWDAGIVVLPLAAPREFAAAVWRVGTQPVVVLKESRAFAAYWLFDLAHELGHLAHGHVEETGIIEVASPSRADLADGQEAEATAYALQLLLPDPQGMLDEVRLRTGDDAPRRFKFAVEAVAAKANVEAGLLGIIAAHAMHDVPEEKDRWGSANNLAKAEDPDGRRHVEAAFRARIELSGLDEIDAALLRAIFASR
jgi:transcriptional regulator with XRE-family HTH domain